MKKLINILFLIFLCPIVFGAVNALPNSDQSLKKLGLTLSEAINLLLVQIKLQKGLPFEIKIPNETTRKAMEETDKGVGLKKAKNVEDLFNQIGE